MNNERRKTIRSLVGQLETIKEEIDTLHSEEEGAMYSMPENMQYNSARWDAAEEAMTQLDEAMTNIESVVDALEEAAQ